MKDTFYQLCVIATITILAITLCINFVSATGIYGDLGEITHGGIQGLNETVQVNQSAWEGFINLIGGPSGVLAGLLTIAAVTSALYTIIKGGSTTLLAGFVFTIVFWGSWINLFVIGYIGGWIPIGITAIATGLITPLFIGGIIGIFSGAG